MTNEEAIGFGKMWLDLNADAKDSLTYKFFERALEGLKAEPCEDAVSREAVLEAIKNNYRMAAIDAIEKLPPVTSKLKTGVWIKLQKNGDGTSRYMCSKCGDTMQLSRHTFATFRSCPKCYAKMEGVEE